MIKLSTIKPNPSNPRVIKDERFEKLKKSITEFPKMMALRPMVVNSDNIVLGGNMRLKALKELGYKEVPDEWIRNAQDLTEEEQRRFIIADNVGFGEHDWELLQTEWDVDELSDWGLDIPDWEEPTQLEAQEDDYEIPDEIQTDIVLGDLFEIGEHRLLCGDSTCSDTVAKLMGGEKADMVLTDPPYGISYEESKNWAKPDYNKRPIIGDNKPFDFNEYAFPKAKMYCIWGANYFSNTIPFYNDSNYIVWAKAHSEEENKVFGSAFELCLMHPKHKQEVWFVRRVNMGKDENGLHPTQKPIDVISRCIRYHDSDKPKTIVDLFLGSGSTMVAAHQLKRKCYGMELDPKYCQVIIDRMLKLDPTLEIKRNGQIYEQNRAI